MPRLRRSLDPASGSSRHTLLILFLVVFLDLAGFGMILPLLPSYAKHFGGDAFQVGLLFACYSLAQFIAAPLWGRLSDRIGRRPVLLISIVGSFVSYLIFAFARDLPTLFVARSAAGAFAANYGVAQAYLADVSPPEQRARRLGLLGAAFGLGFLFGPAMGGIFGEIGLMAVPLAAAGLAGLNALLAWFQLPESRRRTDRFSRAGGERRSLFAQLRSRPALFEVFALFFLVMFAFAMMEATLALFCEARFGFGVARTSWLFALVGLVMVLVQGGLMRRLGGRVPERRLVQVGLVGMAVGLLLIPASFTVGALATTVSLLALGAGIHNPSVTALLSRMTHEESQGSALGASRSLSALARVLGPAWGGWAFHNLGISAPFDLAGAMLCVLALSTLWVFRRDPLASAEAE